MHGRGVALTVKSMKGVEAGMSFLFKDQHYRITQTHRQLGLVIISPAISEDLIDIYVSLKPIGRFDMLDLGDPLPVDHYRYEETTIGVPIEKNDLRTGKPTDPPERSFVRFDTSIFDD